MNSYMVALLMLAQEQGIKVVHIGTEMAGARPDFTIIDEIEPLKLASCNSKVRTFDTNKQSQNNDWRKGRKFNGYHRSF